MDSILLSVKKDLGIDPSYTHFDPDIIMGINTALSVLNQLGAGPSDGFSITDALAVWSDFIPDMSNLELVKTYVSKKTKMMFDPPSNSSLIEAIDRTLSELEWRIRLVADKE